MRRADQHRAGAVGRRRHRAARLAAGHGAGEEDRSGAAVDRRPDRAVRRRPERCPGRSGGTPDRSLGHWTRAGGQPHRTLVAASVLPVDPVAARAAEAEAAALRRRLLARARMRDAVDRLARRGRSSAATCSRAGCRRQVLAGRGSDITDLLRACLVALHAPDDVAAAHRPRPPPLWRVSDALLYLHRRVAGLPRRHAAGGVAAPARRHRFRVGRCAVAPPSPAPGRRAGTRP